MKKLIYIFCLVNLISTIDYVLKAGRKYKSHCDKNDLIFIYKNCFFVNELVPSFNGDFSLLIDAFYKANCQINKFNFISTDFEILCRIENYFGCKEGKPDFPKNIKETKF